MFPRSGPGLDVRRQFRPGHCKLWADGYTLGQMTTMDQADRYIDRVNALPPAPAIAAELLGLLSDPRAHTDRFVELVRHDPALTGRVLKLCNNGFFGEEDPAADIFDAVMRLGYYEIYFVVAALVSSNAMAIAKNAEGFDINELWQHTVTSAVAGEKLAQRVGEPPAVAFTVALLHEIGQLVFAAVEPARYAEVRRQTEMFGGSLAVAERAAFGVAHATVGARLLVRWGLPESVCQAVRHHNDPPAAARPHERLVAVVQMAHTLADYLATPDFSLEDWSAGHPEAMNLLGLTAEDLPLLLEQIETRCEQVQGFSKLSFCAAV